LYEALIEAQVMAMRLACRRMTAQRLMASPDDLQQCPCLSASLPWDRKAATHAEFFAQLADAAGDPVLAGILRAGADCMLDLALVAGPAAADMMASSHQRLLSHQRDGDVDAAVDEMEEHLGALHELAAWSSSAATGQLVTFRRSMTVAPCRA
jgi:DNA-binding GntR family transcriptional regulator